jgi:RNA polymerase sigma factor (TIGR02999 family)
MGTLTVPAASTRRIAYLGQMTAPTDPESMTRADPVSPLDANFARVYDELRALAHRQLRRRDAGAGTVTTTALVHEAYLRLSVGHEVVWQDRAHFFALAARAMRFVLVDQARARLTLKRDGGHPVTLDDAHALAAETPHQLLAIHEALSRLEEVSVRLAQVVHLRFFAGLGHEEVAEVLGVSVPTVKRDWARARAWLYQFVSESERAADP